MRELLTRSKLTEMIRQSKSYIFRYLKMFVHKDLIQYCKILLRAVQNFEEDEEDEENK